MTSSSVVGESGHSIMESFLRSQAFTLASNTYQITADALNYLSGELNGNETPTSIKTYSLLEVAQHDTHDDCWVVIYDNVYDLGKFMNMHPGGNDVLFENAGRDATMAFKSVGHSSDALIMMEKFCIGVLVENERLYTRKSRLY